MLKNHDLTCKVGIFKNGKAILILQTEIEGKKHQQKILIPRTYLPKKTESGDIIIIKFLTKNEASKVGKELARDILNEILDIK